MRLVDSPLGEIPEGWEVRRFTEVADVLSGGTPRTSVPEYWGGEIAWFTPKDIPDTFYVLDTERKITGLGLSKCNSQLYPADTAFITARGTVGRCVLAAVPEILSNVVDRDLTGGAYRWGLREQ
jgi:type I restriction enzyme S subunit